MENIELKSILIDNDKLKEILKEIKDIKRRNIVLIALMVLIIGLAIVFGQENSGYFGIYMAILVGLRVATKHNSKGLDFLFRACFYVDQINRYGVTDLAILARDLPEKYLRAWDRNAKGAVVERDFAELKRRGLFSYKESTQGNVNNGLNNVEVKQETKGNVNNKDKKVYDKSEEVFSANNIGFIRLSNLFNTKTREKINTFKINIIIVRLLSIFLVGVSGLLIYMGMLDGFNDLFMVGFPIMLFVMGIVVWVSSNISRNKQFFYQRAEKYGEYITNQQVNSLDDLAEYVPDELFKKEKDTKYEVAKKDLKKLIFEKFMYIDKN